MANLLQFPAHLCLTAAGVLIHQGRVLLIKHKKIGIWLNPGGHIEANELPHHAAEREFWEETGIKTTAQQWGDSLVDGETQYVPNPICSNLHWVCQDNFEHRVHGAPLSEYAQTHWRKGCEQHLNFLYLLQPVSGVEFKENTEETDGIAWFTPQEVLQLETPSQIKQEVALAFAVLPTVSTHK